MGTKREYSVTVIPDEEGEEFSPSSCACKECALMHIAQTEWDTFIPETRLQKQMMATIARIEARVKNGWKSNTTEVPKRLKTRRKRRRKS